MYRHPRGVHEGRPSRTATARPTASATSRYVPDRRVENGPSRYEPPALVTPWWPLPVGSRGRVAARALRLDR
jgi:hypothetical protein